MKSAAHTVMFGAFGLVIACVIFFGSGVLLPHSWSNALFPGFFLSAMLTVREHAAFGNIYIVVGLLLNAVIYGTATLLSTKLIRGIRHAKSR